MQMRQLMAIGCRIICDIHICITVCFHRKREIISRHITLAHKPGEHHMLDIRIVAGQPWIPAGQFPKSISCLFLHISIICYVSVFIPLYFSAVFVTLLYDIIAKCLQFFYLILPFLCFLIYRKRGTVIIDRTVSGHNKTDRNRYICNNKVIDPAKSPISLMLS